MKKKTNIMRVAVAMLALTMITSCFVGGTFAKYSTSGSGSDSARVAKFGVQIEGPKDLFATQYSTDDETATFEGDYSVDGQGTKVVAPGTSGEATLFTLKGTPEVAVRINVTLNKDNALKMISMPVSEKFLVNFGAEVNPWEEEDTPIIHFSARATESPASLIDKDAKKYYPIVWTLKKDGDAIKTGKLSDINAYLEKLSDDYAPNTDLSELFGTYTLAWEWTFEQAENMADYDEMDTYLGDVMAGVKTDSSVTTTEEFALSVTVTQID